MAEQEDNKTDGSRSSTPTPCPICLGPFLQESYLDQCFHKFCYNCILRWTKVISYKHSLPPSSVKCPLCKTENFSIIHRYDGSSFQRHYINQDVDNSAFFSEAHKYRLRCYYVEADCSLADQFKVSRYWKSRKNLQQNRCLQSWLRREIQALIQEEDVEIVVHHILGVVDSLRSDPTSLTTPEASQANFKALVFQAARPFLSGRTDRFVNEVELFLASGLNMEAYDEVYMQHFGQKHPGISNEDEEGVVIEHEPSTPYLYFFYDDSDGNE